nr:hypothetical protein [Tanacetum cinerariifolium]
MLRRPYLITTDLLDSVHHLNNQHHCRHRHLHRTSPPLPPRSQLPHHPHTQPPPKVRLVFLSTNKMHWVLWKHRKGAFGFLNTTKGALDFIEAPRGNTIGYVWVAASSKGYVWFSRKHQRSLENSDLYAQLQEKFFAITTLKTELRKINGKNGVNTVVSKPNATLALGMFKLEIEPVFARLKNNRDAHEVYIDKTIEYADTLCGFIERARTQYPSEPLLESTCMFTKHVQELLVYASQTCPNSPKPSKKLVAVTPSNKVKRVRFVEPITSSNNIPKQNDSFKTKDSNKPLLTSTGVKPTTSASGSKRSSNTKNNRILQPPRTNQKNKVKDHPWTVKSSLNKMNFVFEPISNALVKHFVRNAKFESMCVSQPEFHDAYNDQEYDVIIVIL